MKRVLILLSWMVASAGVAIAQTDRPAPLVGGGLYRAEPESLGYDGFRVLPDDEQIGRRKEARLWLRRGNDLHALADQAAEGDSRTPLLRQAMDCAATAAGLCPYLPDAWIDYAGYLVDLGRYRQADLCLDHASGTLRYERRERQRNDLTAELYRFRAVVAYNLGDIQASHRAAIAALDVEANDEMLLLDARALIELGRPQGARARLRKFDEDSPAFARSLAVLAILEMQEEHYEAADDAFASAHEYGMRGAVFENDRGRLALLRERYAEAVSHFKSAISTLPTMYEARSNLAVAYWRGGDLARAEEVLVELLEMRADYGPGHFNLAEILRDQMDAVEGEARTQLGRRALIHYTEALEAGYDARRVVERRAQLSVLSEDLEQAEEDLLRMTEDPDTDPRVLFLLGRVKKEQGRLDIALNLLRMAEQRGYDDALLYADLGEVLLRRGDLPGARDALERAIDMRADLIVTRVNLSSVLLQLGEFERADAVLREAELRRPDHELVREQRLRLEAQRPEVGG